MIHSRKFHATGHFVDRIPGGSDDGVNVSSELV